MKNNINGFQNEFEICNELNNKKVKQLNPMFKSFIEDLFENELNDEYYIKCIVDESNKKYDIVVSINNSIKRISIKKGIKNSVHVEGISSFIHFLIQNEVSRQNINEYLRYHYADGTTNGSGKNRISSAIYKINNQEAIDKINKQFNTEYMLLKIVDRFILKGNISEENIDALLYGTKNDFIWVKREEIKSIILSKKDKYSSAIHFGPLTVQPLDRCLNHNPKYEKRRFCVQIKWYNIFDDIIEYKNKQTMIESGYIDSPQHS